MLNNPLSNNNLSPIIERVIHALDIISGQNPIILEEDVFRQHGINLKLFYPAFSMDGYEKSDMAFEVVEGKWYDLVIGAYRIIPLISDEEQKNHPFKQRYIILYKCDLIFKLFTDIRAINIKIISGERGIWAYKNDSELYSNREMADRMVKKLEAERGALLEKRDEILNDFQKAGNKSGLISGFLKILLLELDLPKF